ncbi:MAG: ribonuclease E/G [Acidobacteriota bacterium]
MLREILIDSAGGEIRVAVLEDGLLTEAFIERPGSRGVAGNIYKGRVSNILPGMQSAFVDIGLDRNAFLHVEDLVGRSDDLGGTWSEGGVESAPAAPPARSCGARIEELLGPGQEIIVQVARDPVGQKGARITSQVAVPGRFLVLLPNVDHVGVSRRIEDPGERDRLRGLVGELAGDLGEGAGFIVRTAGEGRAAAGFLSDARYLAGLWNEVRRLASSRAAPALLHREVGAVAKVLRDLFHQDVAKVVVDAPSLFEEAVGEVSRMQPELACRIHLHAGPEPLFGARGVQRQLDRALRPRVWLRSGASIVINQTEALVAIDVNTGKYVGGRGLEETILRTNLEAAAEIARQIRLRDLAGIIVIDFIDMASPSNRERVFEALRRELRKDRSRVRVLEISEFGLVEITRQRTRPSLERLLCQACPSCGGSGRVKSPETLYFEIVREAREVLRRSPGRSLRVRVPSRLAPALEAQCGRLWEALGLEPPARIHVQEDATLGQEQIVILPV